MQPVFGSSNPTKKLLSLIEKLAGSSATVLILGESGSGKEVLARLIHDRSVRSEQAFVPVNCGAIPGDLLESELFGHQKGAFTGAVSDRVGKIVSADNGTLFLDEIGDMPLEMQVKLLRVIQERKVDPVGSNNSISVNVRIMLPHIDPSKAKLKVLQGRTLQRLNVTPCPFRERREEIPLLLTAFAEHFADDSEARVSLKKDLEDLVMEYEWPGNVRELANFVQRLSVLYPGQKLGLTDVDPVMLPNGVQTIAEEKLENSASSLQLDFGDGTESENSYEDIVLAARGVDLDEVKEMSLKETLGRIESDVIKRALDEVNGNVSMCARLLKMRRTTLIERMKKLQVS